MTTPNQELIDSINAEIDQIYESLREAWSEYHDQPWADESQITSYDDMCQERLNELYQELRAAGWKPDGLPHTF